MKANEWEVEESVCVCVCVCVCEGGGGGELLKAYVLVCWASVCVGKCEETWVGDKCQWGSVCVWGNQSSNHYG